MSDVLSAEDLALADGLNPPEDGDDKQWWEGIADETLRESAKGLGSLDDVVKKATAEPPANQDWWSGIEDEALRESAKKFENVSDVVKKAMQDPQPGDWRSSLTDEKHKNVASRFNSPAEMVQAVIDSRNEVTQRIRVPDEKASDEDKERFYKATGWPEDIKEYEVEAPEGVEMTDEDKSTIEQVLPIFHEAHAPKALVGSVLGKLVALSHELQAASIKDLKDAQDAADEALKREWGTDYEPNKNLANRAADKLGGEDFVAFLENAVIDKHRLGDHPTMMKFLSKIGRMADEGGMEIRGSAEELASVEAQIEELNKKVPIGTAEYRTQAHQEKLQELYRKLAGSQPIVGGQGRAA